MILALAAVLALTFTVPALGGGTPLFRLAKHADNKAERGLHRASRALKRASRGLRAGKRARKRANLAQAQIDAAGVKASTVAATASTAEASGFVDLGGPRVNVQVPASGLIEVWAQVTMDDDGAVSLFEDGRQMPGQAELCTNGAIIASDGLVSGLGQSLTLATPPVPGLAQCATEGPPGPVLFQVTPGPHTYELRYQDCSCGGTGVSFSQRRLFVAPRL